MPDSTANHPVDFDAYVATLKNQRDHALETCAVLNGRIAATGAEINQLMERVKRLEELVATIPAATPAT